MILNSGQVKYSRMTHSNTGTVAWCTPTGCSRMVHSNRVQSHGALQQGAVAWCTSTGCSRVVHSNMVQSRGALQHGWRSFTEKSDMSVLPDSLIKPDKSWMLFNFMSLFWVVMIPIYVCLESFAVLC